VLLGRNGTGKSTLLKACLGVLKPRAGTVRVLGMDPACDRDAALTHIGYVPDRPDIYGWMRPRDLFRLLRAHHPRWSDVRAAELCARLEVPQGTRMRAMSRGQGMRTMLAAALVPEPEVLLLDEPFGGIDVGAREDILRGVLRVLDGGTRTVLVTTHDLDIAARLADHVAVLEAGRLVTSGPLEALVGEGAPERGLRALLVDEDTTAAEDDTVVEATVTR
jgi:ABC-2 type transport system ATP-binding protein